MAEVYKIGPCAVLYGDPTQAAGAGMNFLGHIRGEVTVNPQINISMGRVDAKGMIGLASTLFNAGAQPVASIPFVDEEKAKLKELLPGSSIETNGGKTALVLGKGVKRIALSDIKTLAIVPIDELDEGTNGIDAPNAWWFPRAICNSFGAITFNLPEGEDNLSSVARTTAFASLYHATDLNGGAVPENARVGFQGSPEGAGCTGWTLPDLSAVL